MSYVSTWLLHKSLILTSGSTFKKKKIQGIVNYSYNPIFYSLLVCFFFFFACLTCRHQILFHRTTDARISTGNISLRAVPRSDGNALEKNAQ